MKYSIDYSCGHHGERQIHGSAQERERKYKFFQEQGLCPECYKKKMHEDKIKEDEEYGIKVLVKKTESGELRLFMMGSTYPVKEILKSHGYKWDGEYWKKEIDGSVDTMNTDIWELKKDIPELKARIPIEYRASFNNFIKSKEEEK